MPCGLSEREASNLKDASYGSVGPWPARILTNCGAEDPALVSNGKDCALWLEVTGCIAVLT